LGEEVKVIKGLDRVLGEENWGRPKWVPGYRQPKLKMSYFGRTGWLPKERTIGDYWEQAVKMNPDGLAFVDTVEGEEWAVTYKEAAILVKRLALTLIDMGIKPGGKVATAMLNSVAFALSILAINYIGAVWVPLHAFLREAEWRYILRHADVEVLICDELHRGYSLAKLASNLQPEMDLLKKVIVRGNPEPGQMLFYDVIKKDWSDKYSGNYLENVYFKENLFTSDNVSEIIYTSGTTGPPKGAMHTHNTNLCHSLGHVHTYNLDSKDSLLNLAIMSHQHGYGVLWLPFVISALPIYLVGDWNPDNVLKTIDKYKPTMVGLNPPIVTALTRHPDIGEYDTSSIKAFVTAGAPLPVTSSEEAYKKMKNPDFRMFNVYGMSECNGECSTPWEFIVSPEFPAKSVGWPLIDAEVKITEVGNRDKIIPVGKQGEIGCKGSLVGVGYYKDPERTHADWDTKGWMYSGDLGEMDEEGNIYITGRAKDIILRGGNVVQPLFIEEFIRQYSGVADVTIVGIPHDTLTEAVCAVIAPKEKGKVFTREEIYNFMKDKIARDNIPDRIETWDSLIYTATGKQIKYRIREKVLENMRKEITDSERKDN